MPTVNKQSGEKKKRKYIDGYTKKNMALIAVSDERQLTLLFGVLPSPFYVWI